MRIVDRLRAQLSINDLARSDRSRMEWEDPFKRERNKKESKDEDLNPSVYGMAGEAYKNDNQFEDTEMHMGMAVRASTDFYRKMKEVTGQIPRSPYSKYLDEHPDLETSEFEEYVVVNNRDDRDSGELADISKEEIERLGGEFLKSAQYSEYEQPRQIESPDPKPHADVKEYGSMNGPRISRTKG